MAEAHLLPRWSVRALVFSPHHDLHVTARALLCALDNYRSARSPQPFPSQATLAADLNVSEPTVRAAIARAIEAGWLVRHARQTAVGRLNDVYELRVPDAVVAAAKGEGPPETVVPPPQESSGGLPQESSGGIRGSRASVDTATGETTTAAPAGAAGSEPGTALAVVPRSYDLITAWVDPALRTALEAVEHNAQDRVARERLYRALAALVFAYSAAKWHHEGTRLDDKRLRRLVARLHECKGDVSMLLYAADGALKDDNIAGRRDDSPGYLRISTVYRDLEQVERLARLARWKPGAVHGMARAHGLGAAA